MEKHYLNKEGETKPNSIYKYIVGGDSKMYKYTFWSGIVLALLVYGTILLKLVI
jgi:hypothetical protein